MTTSARGGGGATPISNSTTRAACPFATKPSAPIASINVVTKIRKFIKSPCRRWPPDDAIPALPGGTYWMTGACGRRFPENRQHQRKSVVVLQSRHAVSDAARACNTNVIRRRDNGGQ